MSTEIRVPIKVTGWVMLRDLRVDRVEIDLTDWEYSPIPYVTEYGDQDDVIVFRDLAKPGAGDRFEADVDITEPIHQMIDRAGIEDHRWVSRLGIEIERATDA